MLLPQKDKDGQAIAPPIGLALGGGVARGWAHIGAIRALVEAGIRLSLIHI